MSIIGDDVSEGDFVYARLPFAGVIEAELRSIDPLRVEDTTGEIHTVSSSEVWSV